MFPMSEKASLLQKIYDGDDQTGELKQQLLSVEEDIKQARGREEEYQEEVKLWEGMLQSLSDQQDEGTMECSEHIV